MNKFQIIVATIIGAVLGIIGFFLANWFPLPSPYTLTQTRLIYIFFGILISILIFARIATWILRTTTSLTRKLVLKIASETINQLTNLTSSGLHLFPTSLRRSSETKINKPLIVDTSAIIDGRILNVAESGFLAELILIPDFVLTELQSVADSSDPLKRARARRGFEIINELKKIDGLTVKVWDKSLSGKTVDDKLIRLSKALRGKLLTCDFNLSQVAKVSGIRILNLNDLSNALKSLPIPGETLSIKVVSPGKDRSQGVGYLSDGTMVVVKDAADKVSRSIEVEVTKIIQGPAGRMIFGKIA